MANKDKIWSFKRYPNLDNSFENTIVEIRKEGVTIRLNSEELRKLKIILDTIKDEECK